MDSLNSFIHLPDLRLDSEDYPFKNFSFKETYIDNYSFQYPTQLIIGKQAEAAFEAYLSNSQYYELSAKNTQIYSSHPPDSGNKRETIGELDYIVKDLHTQESIHIELACKFYLYDRNLSNTEEKRWIGPNRKDSLFDKLEIIKYKQFPLLKRKETIEYLTNHHLEIPTSQEMCLKALLFIPMGTKKELLPRNYQDCVMGQWIRHLEFLKLPAEGTFTLRNKKEWLNPDLSQVKWLSLEEIKPEVLYHIQNQNSPLVYHKTNSTIEKLFVVWW